MLEVGSLWGLPSLPTQVSVYETCASDDTTRYDSRFLQPGETVLVIDYPLARPKAHHARERATDFSLHGMVPVIVFPAGRRCEIHSGCFSQIPSRSLVKISE